jgi:hypothetical protein
MRFCPGRSSGVRLISGDWWTPQNQDVRIRLLVLAVVCAASLCAQAKKKFSWQDACFKNPAAPYCPGHDFAVKPPPKEKTTATPAVITRPFPSTTPRPVTPSLIVVGALDWRFADPFADELVGFNFSGLAASPLAHSLIAQLGAKRGLTESDIQKIFDGLAGVDQVALSIRDNRVVVMITGSVTNSALTMPEAGLKGVPVSGSAMLVGHPEAVDQAMMRVAMKSPTNELIRSAEERQANSGFWAMASARLLGTQAMSAGLKQFLLTVSLQNRLASDLTFEFHGVPSADAIRTLQATLGAVTLEGNAVHFRTSMEADEVRQKFGQIVDSPLGEGLATLVEAARYLPARDSAASRSGKPVIYGLDGGPREVNQ